MNSVGIPLVTFPGEEIDKIMVRHSLISLQITKKTKDFDCLSFEFGLPGNINKKSHKMQKIPLLSL